MKKSGLMVVSETESMVVVRVYTRREEKKGRRGVCCIYNNVLALMLKSPNCPWCLHCVKESVFIYHFCILNTRI